MKFDQRDSARHNGLYESASLWRPAKDGQSDSSSPAIQTSPALAPASTPPTPSSTLDPANFEVIWADSASEHSDDWLDLEEDSHTVRNTPSALDARAMAEDFSEGRLETFVGSPQKELAGTQNAYVSYLVTTKVHHIYVSIDNTINPLYAHTPYSPTTSPSKSPNSQSAAASPTSSSSGNSSRKNTRNALSLRCPTSTRWSMFVETASARTSRNGAHTPCTASSSD
jgi:hypothetical protein